MPLPNEYGDPYAVSATGTVVTGRGVVVGFLGSTSTSGTITLRDGTSGSPTPFLAATPVTAGQFLPIKAGFETGLHCTIGGTATGTFVVAR